MKTDSRHKKQKTTGRAENIIGALILLVLAVIAAGVFVKQSRYDEGVFFGTILQKSRQREETQTGYKKIIVFTGGNREGGLGGRVGALSSPHQIKDKSITITITDELIIIGWLSI